MENATRNHEGANSTLSRIFEALASETRVRIVREVAASKGMYCSDVQARFHLSQPTMSHHFRKLIGAGILVAHKEGKRHFYTVDGNFLERHGLRFLEAKGGR